MTAHPTQPLWQIAVEQESEALLDAIERGWKPPCSTADLDQVREDALRSLARLPAPQVMAEQIEAGEPCLAAVLRAAYISRMQPIAGCWRIEDGIHARPLRNLGLVEVGGPALTTFGNSVRKCLLGLHREGVRR